MEGEVARLAALCPACGFEHNFSVDLVGHGKWPKGHAQWTFDGNYASPTFSPSMLANKAGVEPKFPICHSHVKNGVWEFLADCTHDMAGQHVPMIPPDTEMSWYRRHGWHLIDPDKFS